MKTFVTQQCQITFFISKCYVDEVLCDVIEIDACHLILGRACQYDVDATYHSKDNVYVFFRIKRKIFLRLIREGRVPKDSKVEGKPSLLIINNKEEFDKEARELKQVFVVVLTDGEPKKVA